MDLFGAAHGCVGEKKAPSLKSVTHSAVMKLGTVMAYLKKIQKIYKSHDAPLDFCWYQLPFTGNQQTLPYQEIQLDCILIHCNFDDVSKIGYSRPS